MKVALNYNKAQSFRIGRILLTRSSPFADLSNEPLDGAARQRIAQAIADGVLMKTRGDVVLDIAGEAKMTGVKENEGDTVRITWGPDSIKVETVERAPEAPSLILIED